MRSVCVRRKNSGVIGHDVMTPAISWIRTGTFSDCLERIATVLAIYYTDRYLRYT